MKRRGADTGSQSEPAPVATPDNAFGISGMACGPR